MVWIDVTEVRNWQGHHTGIQRVITKLGEQLMKDEKNFKTCYFDYSTNVFRACSYNFSREVEYKSDAISRPTFSERLRRKTQYLIQQRASERTKNKVKEIRRLLGLRNIKDSPVPFAEEDVLLIPGAFWIYPLERLEWLKKEKKIVLAGVLYDLVPLIVPQYTAEVTVVGYGQRFAGAMSEFDTWFAISENTKKDAVTEVEKMGITVDKDRLYVMRLGVDQREEDMPSAKPPEFTLQPDTFCLFVSTIEARKNQALLYQAVKLLETKGGRHLPIVLVGKRGWLSDDFLYTLEHDKSIEGRIIWLSRVDDKGLRWLYENCAFTIYPSLYEGWGLPIAESFAYGKPCISSNRSSMPEVGGIYAEYFSPYSSDELAQLLKKYSDRTYISKRKKMLATYKPETWAETAEVVRKIILR